MAGLVLITRPEPGASDTAARLRAAGLDPVVAPFLTIHPVAANMPPAGMLQAVVAASGNAAEALPAAYQGLALLAVGDATAARARRAGFTAVESADGDAADLAALASARLEPGAGAVLLAVGRGQGAGLAEDLRHRGFRVQRRVVYTAAPVGSFPAAAAQAVGGGLRAAMFFSADTAKAFAKLLPPALEPALGAAEALAIGSAAAAAVRHLPWRAVRVAVRPTQDGVLALL